MQERKVDEEPALFDLEPAERGHPLARWQVWLGIAAVLFAAFFVIWLILGSLSVLASPLAVFGVDGLRVLAGLITGGLLIASLVLADF
jgi:hypothetical protein